MSIAIFILHGFFSHANYTLIMVGDAIKRSVWYARCVMEKNEIKIKRLSPIVETIWGVLILVSSLVLLFVGG